ncbi:MAG TPA: replication-associated recombination protein A [Ignavibacteria bacterium]|nr:replication-associated recombination protein A [Ignavibacteria bacterium]
MDLFDNNRPETLMSRPLAERLRPNKLDDFVGQKHLVGKGKPINLMLESKSIVSMIFWGPPGVGKTTLALLISKLVDADFIQLSAVSAGVKDVREAIDKAERSLKYYGKRTILFIDEIHRFNKSQQDSLLHSVEKGIIILIGATTENPSFEVISPLLSRCRVYTLEELGKTDFEKILKRAVGEDILLKDFRIKFEDEKFLISLSNGDARRLLNGLELAVKLAGEDEDGVTNITNAILKDAFQTNYIKYDKNAEEHYNIISAFIKSLRGSDPDAAVYWLARMLKGGEDPKFIARRMVVLASEDIGNADPYAITMAVSTFSACEYIGMPEARIILSQCATYLACSPKSNASYMAISAAEGDVNSLPSYDVPLHLRNAPTKLMKELGYHKGYKYAHDFEGHYAEQLYLPQELMDKIYYNPSEMGREEKFKKYLDGTKRKKIKGKK